MVFEQIQSNFSIISFFISIGLAVSFFTVQLIQSHFDKKATKNTINANVLQLVKIYDRLYADVDEITGTTDSDSQKASDIALFFERKYARIEMIRMNIENQLIQIGNDITYRKNILQILQDLDLLVEICYNPKLPLQYQLSIWQDNKDMIRSATRNTVDVATNKLKLEI